VGRECVLPLSPVNVPSIRPIPCNRGAYNRDFTVLGHLGMPDLTDCPLSRGQRFLFSFYPSILDLALPAHPE